MNENIFVKKMREISPSIADLKKLELSNEFCKRIIESLNVKEKVFENDAIWNIEKLLYKYDMSKTEIGSITFLNLPINMLKYIHFGTYDLFRLVLDKDSGRIIYLDEYEDVVCGYCADDESCFLDALIESEKHFIERLFNANLYEDQGLICSTALKISDKAGGKMFLDFYKNLLGCFS